VLRERRVGAPGKNGLGGYQTTTTATYRGTNEFRPGSGTAKCPAGKKAIGGGYSIGTDSGGGKTFPSLAITASEPTANGQGWTATAYLQDPKDVAGKTKRPQVRLTVTAICAKVS
jgi:hypothetical protein